jgi:2'-5' RNA ligase
VLWVGFEGETKRLVQLQGRIEGALLELRFEPERQRFTPHATAGRLNNEVKGFATAQVGRAWGALRLPPGLPDIGVESVALYRSHLGREGARYEKLFEARLG